MQCFTRLPAWWSLSLIVLGVSGRIERSADGSPSRAGHVDTVKDLARQASGGMHRSLAHRTTFMRYRSASRTVGPSRFRTWRIRKHLADRPDAVVFDESDAPGSDANLIGMIRRSWTRGSKERLALADVHTEAAE